MITVFHRTYEAIVGRAERIRPSLRVPAYAAGMIGVMTGAAGLLFSGPLMVAGIWAEAAAAATVSLALGFVSLSVMIGALTGYYTARLQSVRSGESRGQCLTH